MEVFDITNDDGSVIGQATRKECHNGSFLLHPVVHALVFNSDGELILQKRSMTKDIQPGKWDTSVGGHINPGETNIEAVIREADEELGIKKTEFEKIYQYIMTTDVERELVYSFKCIYTKTFNFNKEEIDEIRFFSKAEIDTLIGKNFFTPNFEEEWKLYKKLIEITRQKD
jgi:isopentenyl-diphosphate delta-isomerase type 1